MRFVIAARNRSWLLAPLLFGGTLALFWPAVHGEFVHYDDDVYVTGNPDVQRGLSLASLRWAFTTFHAVNWHPLTWLSHMVDASLWGADPWGHHLTSVLLHALNAATLFAVLLATTRAPLPAFLAAALFAVHPLRVESVAWVSERKDVLSALFGFLAIGAYSGWCAHGGAARYTLLLLLAALSLLAKPMLVTLPLLLLLLDLWPLHRAGALPWRRLVLEKLPLVAMSGAVAIVTVLAQRHGPMRSLAQLPLAARVENAALSCTTYLGQLFWPVGLVVLYPHPGASVAAWKGLAAGALLLALVAGAWRCRAVPSLRTGWLWYLVALLPVIGLVQVGFQAHADRYTYVPSIGIALALVYGGAWLASRSRAAAFALPALALVAIGGLVPLTREQISVWRSSETLFRHALEVAPDNSVIQMDLGVLLASQGKSAEARSHLESAVAADPTSGAARSALGRALVLWDRAAEAEAILREALRIDPDAPRAHQNLGMALQRQGKWKEAAEHYRLALERNDALGVESVHESLAYALHMSGDEARARAALELLTRRYPGYLRGHLLLGSALLQSGRFDDAAAAFRRALALNPASAEASEGLRRALARSR